MADRPLSWLSKYLSLGMTLPAAVFAGYILARIVQHWFPFGFLTVVGIFLGMAAGLYQIVKELDRDSRRNS